MDYFLLNSSTGQLRTARRLDREKIDNENGIVKLIVRAREIDNFIVLNNSNSFSSIDISITITDVNDSPPTFNKKEYFVNLPENTPNGTLLPLDINVFDADVGNNSVFSLRLGDLSETFKVEPNVVVGSSYINIRVWNGNLDYENPNHRKFIVLLIAEEIYTIPQLSSTATIHVNLLDINDHYPFFEKDNYIAKVSETIPPGAFILQTLAKDVDTGLFGDEGLIYSLHGTGADLFTIDKKNGVITVAECSLNGIKLVNDTDKFELTISENEERYFNDKPQLGKQPCLDYEFQNEYFLTVSVSISKA